MTPMRWVLTSTSTRATRVRAPWETWTTPSPASSWIAPRTVSRLTASMVGQFALARQLVADLQDAGRDHRDDLVADHFLGGLLVDRLVQGRERPRHHVHRQLDR